MFKIFAFALALIATSALVAAPAAQAGAYNGKTCSNRTSGDMKKGYSC